MNKINEHCDRVNHLLEALEEARIFAGAEFEALCNDNEHIRAVYFSSLRDMLATYIKSTEDYKYIAQIKQ